MNKNNSFPRHGEIWLLKNIDKLKEITKDYRPVLIISANERNQYDSSVVVLPLTTEDLESILPVEVLIDSTPGTGLQQSSKILCDSPLTFNKSLRFEKKIGLANSDIMEQIRTAWKIAFFNE